ncbi:MAG TPA: DNA polymerase III subunit gamma/tau [Gemmatimonadaceae bacterium]|nr:DNA polymerase III subunit gamma/tau [Gemmatimonadaceae bacterium]
MISLARKYRPKKFSEVAVQTHVSNTLRGAIERGRVAHGYLLCGPRGTGKTTLARVLAMALNCENRDASGEPCGQCTSCVRIWSGASSLDVVEIDAASNRGVDDARDLRERAMYAPSGENGWKVYIIDEAHMLTREAWNALLKILEEPPPRVVFVFATTEPQKIAQFAAPVLSRLQRFDFKRISGSEIRGRLSAVLGAEKVEADPDALSMIGRAADGSMRDALSLTDQVLAFHDGRLTTDAVRDALGLVAEDEQLAMLDIVAERRAGDVFAAVSRLVDEGVDLGLFLAGFGDMVRAQLAVELRGDAGELSERTRAALVERRGRLVSGDLLRMLSALGELEPRFRRSTQQQLLLETTLVRFALLDRMVAIEDVLKGIGAENSPGPRGSSPSPGGSGRLSPPGRSEMSARSVETPTSVERVNEPAPPVARASTPLRLVSSSGVATDVAPTPAQPMKAVASKRRTVAASDLNAVAGIWDDMVAGIRRDRPFIATLLEQSLPVSTTANGVLVLQVEAPAVQEGLAAKTTEILATMNGWLAGLQKLTVRLVGDSVSAGPAPRMTVESVRSETLAALRKRDPVLSAAIDALDLDLLN